MRDILLCFFWAAISSAMRRLPIRPPNVCLDNSSLASFLFGQYCCLSSYLNFVYAILLLCFSARLPDRSKAFVARSRSLIKTAFYLYRYRYYLHSCSNSKFQLKDSLQWTISNILKPLWHESLGGFCSLSAAGESPAVSGFEVIAVLRSLLSSDTELLKLGRS